MVLADLTHPQRVVAYLSLAFAAVELLVALWIARGLMAVRAAVHRYHMRVLLALPIYCLAAVVALLVPSVEPLLEAVSIFQEVLSLVAIYFLMLYFLDDGACIGRCGLPSGCCARCAPRTLIRTTTVLVLQALVLRGGLPFVVAALKWVHARNVFVLAAAVPSALSLGCAVWGIGVLWKSTRALLQRCGPDCEASVVRMFLWVKTVVLVFLLQTAVVQTALRRRLALTETQAAELDSVLRLVELMPFSLWALWAIRPSRAADDEEGGLCGEKEAAGGCDALCRLGDYLGAQWRVGGGSYFLMLYFLDDGACVGRCGLPSGCCARCAPRTLIRTTTVLVLQALVLRGGLPFVVAALKWVHARNVFVLAAAVPSALSLGCAVWGIGVLWKSTRALLQRCGPDCEASVVRMFLWVKTVVLVFLLQTAVVQTALRRRLALTETQAAELDSVLRLVELMPFSLWALWAIRPSRAADDEEGGLCGEKEAAGGCDTLCRLGDYLGAQWRVGGGRCLHKEEPAGLQQAINCSDDSSNNNDNSSGGRDAKAAEETPLLDQASHME
eukprot:m51a1_g5277 hypothetical protein (556) ;mRNA; r:159799-162165